MNAFLLTDALGQRHEPAPDARIVCLVPSITELLCELGLAGKLVGRTGFCIHPQEVVAGIPKVGGTKDVNIEKIRKLAPTHVVVNIDENESRPSTGWRNSCRTWWSRIRTSRATTSAWRA